MNKAVLSLASLMTMVFCHAYAEGVLVEAGGTYTATGSPVMSTTVGNTTANGGLGGLGGTGGNSTVTTGDNTLTTGASSAQGGNASSSGNTSGNNTVSTNFNAAKIPVSTAYAPANYPTSPCMGSSSLGASSTLFGFSTGSTWEATECMKLEMARSFSQAGMLEDALAIRCTSKYAAAAPSCIALLKNK